nr:reverse transcriptase domain-containing protein [Tanacetum cinerariifolium]
MQHKIERLQAQLGDLKEASKDTPYASDPLYPLSQKLENENAELEYQVLNYTKENAHLKTTYKNLFDSIKVTRTQTQTITDSLQDKLNDTIYENAKLRAQLFDKVSELKNTNSDKFMPINNVRASVRKNPITVSQPHVVTKKVVNFVENGFPSTGVDITTKTRRPQPRSNKRNDRVPSASKSSRIKNKEVEVEDHYRNLPLSTNKKHMSSECNNTKLTILNDKSEVVCAMCNGHDGRDPRDVEIERLRQRVRELEVNGLIQMARRVSDYRIRRIADRGNEEDGLDSRARGDRFYHNRRSVDRGNEKVDRDPGNISEIKGLRRRV